MSIQSEINRIEQNVANTYSVLAEAGAPMPASMDSDNLAGTAANIAAVLYNKAQSLTNNQQAQGRNNINAITGSDLTLAIGADGLLYIFAKGVQVGTGIDIATAGDIIGYVDANKNVILKGNLADGTYSIQYELEDGSTIDIGNLTLDSNTYYSITKNLTNCTINNSANEVVEGGSYSATITANDGYELSSVSMTMGDSAVTVTNGVINIASVTGNIIITAVAEVISTELINLAEPNATNTTNFTIWCNDARMGSDAKYRSNPGTIVTNYIEANAGDTFYIQGLNINTTTTNTNNMLALFDSSKAMLTVGAVSNAVANGNMTCEVTDTTIILSLADNKNTNVAYIRFGGSLSGTFEDVIITRNQPID